MVFSKEALLAASDLVEREVELPTIGGSVRVRSLPAAYSSHALSEAVDLQTNSSGQQTAHVNTEKLDALQVLHGLIDPQLSTLEEVNVFATRCGPAFTEVVRAIAEISGIDEEAVQRTNAQFRPGGPGETRPAESDETPDRGA